MTKSMTKSMIDRVIIGVRDNEVCYKVLSLEKSGLFIFV